MIVLSVSYKRIDKNSGELARLPEDDVTPRSEHWPKVVFVETEAVVHDPWSAQGFRQYDFHDQRKPAGGGIMTFERYHAHSTNRARRLARLLGTERRVRQ